MRKVLVGVAVAALALAAGRLTAAEPEKNGGQVMHGVYFTLKDAAPEARQKLVTACKKYLKNHPGEVYFAAGTRGAEFNREVNDRDWDVALLIVFKDRASQDQYQNAARHKQFIAENRDNWKKVRVFDAVVRP